MKKSWKNLRRNSQSNPKRNLWRITENLKKISQKYPSKNSRSIYEGILIETYGRTRVITPGGTERIQAEISIGLLEGTSGAIQEKTKNPRRNFWKLSSDFQRNPCSNLKEIPVKNPWRNCRKTSQKSSRRIQKRNPRNTVRRN